MTLASRYPHIFKIKKSKKATHKSNSQSPMGESLNERKKRKEKKRAHTNGGGTAKKKKAKEKRKWKGKR